MSHPREPMDQEEPLPRGAVLATFAEALLNGRRVALLGDSASSLGGQIAESSGRRVHVFDPDARRAGATIATRRGSANNVVVSPLEDGLDDHIGAFDAVVIPSLAELGDPKELIARVTGLLSKRGVLVLANDNPDTTPDADTIGYYDLYDCVAEHFEHVSMHGQAPFAGFTVAGFAVVGDPAVTIDASLMSAAEEPRMFLAVASQSAVELDPYVLVQVPHRDAAPSDTAAEEHAELVEAKLSRSMMSAELDKVRQREKDQRQLATEREAANKKLAARISELQGALDREKKRASAAGRDASRSTDKLERRVRQLESELERQTEAEDAHQEDLDRMLERIAELEEEVAAAEKKARAAEKRAAEKKKREPPPAPAPAPPAEEAPSAGEIRAFEFQISELRSALATARNERDGAKDELRSLKKRAAGVGALESEIRELKRENEALRSVAEDDDAHGREISELEAQLRERGQTVARLRREMAESERVGRELLGRLLEAQPGEDHESANGEARTLRAQLEALAQRCSRYEADLQAASWKIESLSQSDGEETSDQEKLELALKSAHDDLAKLRRQLDERDRE